MKDNKGFQKWITTLLLLVSATFQGMAANYLCFTAEEANSTVVLYKTGCFVDVLYSFDGEEPWTTWESGDVVTLRNVGDKVYVKGDNPYSFSMSENNYAGFRMTGRIAASGSVMSLIDGVGTSRTIPNAFCFERLFYGCVALVQAPELPATELTAYCYDNMFDNCGITEMPELHASNLSEGCYAGMFRNCEKLTETTSLAAQVMQPECYMQMFKGCSSLAYAPSLISKEMAESCYERMFEGCTSLISPPVLPAIKLAKSCYSHMFNGCTSLTNPPSMPGVPMADFCCSFMYSGCTNLTSTGFLGSHELAPHCYSGMFQGCSKLTRVDKLPATDLAEGCYSSMFSQCTSLTEAPELPAMNLAKSCYESMFTFCQGLTKAPELPATTLAPSCYSSMFNSCRNLTEASELPAMTLASSCYERMYASCLALQKAPELPAAELVESCYNGMFLNCSSLNYIKVGVMSLLNDFSATENWVKKVDDEGIFVFPCGSTYDEHGPSEVPTNFTIRRYKIAIYQNPDSTELWRDSIGCEETPVYRGNPNPPTYGEGKIFKGWRSVFTSDSDPDILYYVAEYEDDASDAANWLYFIAKEPATTISYKNVGGNSPDVQYSLEYGGPWTPLAEGEKVMLENVGDRVFLKGNNPNGFSQAEDVYTQFEIEGLADLSGCVMSLIDGRGVSKVIPNDYCFTRLFENCKINRFMDWYPLPALSLKAYCYSYMFAGCESLVNPVSSLPATELAPYCYSHMFEGCINIPTNMELPAEELAEGCYAYMFNRCSMLFFPYELPAIKLAPYCYSHMFSGCESMYEIPALPASKMEPYCYESMFSGCKAMTKMPLLLSRSLAEGCYSNMFRSCDILSEVFSLPAENLSDMCYYHMFDSCVSLTELPPLPARETKPSCYEGMFRGCIGIVKAPELPAVEMSRQCYRNMFEGCSNLNYIKVGLPSLDNDFDATDNWVKGVDGPGVFIFPCGSWYDKRGDSEVPELFDIYSSPIIIFQNPDSTVLERDTIGCYDSPEYKGATPTFRDGLVFIHWDKPLQPLLKSGIYYFTAEYGSEENPDLVNVLSFTAVEPDSKVWYWNLKENHPDIQYSLDLGKTWVQWEVGDTVDLSRVGDRVYVRGNNPQGFSHGEKFVQKTTSFGMSGGISASGSVMSLIDGVGEATVIPCDSCFYGLFSSCVALRNAPRLPATTLAGSCYMAMFSGCTNLQEAPELPATEMADFCYSHMFYDTRITTPPALPARKLAYGCYSGMFFRCLELTRMPKLPATELAPVCYISMFEFCEKLTQVTELPAMKMEEGCYSTMFSDCVRLGTAPELPATELAPNCYAYMFSHCNSLINAPKLPAEELAEGCYTGMFMMSKCLAEAPELLATELKKECYKEMFGGCDALNYIKVGVKSLDNEVSATDDWVWGVNRKGTFIFPCGSKYDKHGSSEVPTNFEIIASPIAVFHNADGTELQRDTIDCETVPKYRGEGPTYGEGLVFKGWDPEPTLLPFPETYHFVAMYETEGDSVPGNWLCFTTEEDSTIIYLISVGDNAPNLQYSIDGGRTWVDWVAPKNVSLENAGDKMYVRGYNPNGFSFAERKSTSFASTKKVAASGSVMSLIDRTGTTKEIPNAYCFRELFAYSMFTQAPELPATSLKDNCYSRMFAHSYLTRTPELPATELAKGCYEEMFANCDKIEEVPFILPATQLADSCYTWMFAGCTSITKAPELPAQTLEKDCYKGMFINCYKLNYIKVGVMSLDNEFNATEEWVADVDGPGTFIFPCGSKYDKHGGSEVPTDFTIVSSPIAVFQNPDSTELQRDTLDCETVPEYRGEGPTYGEGLVFKGWDPEPTLLPFPETAYFTAVYEEDSATGDWLCFTAEEAFTVVSYANFGDNAPNVQYSIDGGRNWLVWEEDQNVILENAGDKMYVRGDNPEGFSSSSERYTTFSSSKKIAASGSVMSLIDRTGTTLEIPNAYCFRELFSHSLLTQAPELPATSLKDYCYSFMFNHCEHLTRTPELPATEMAKACYYFMFANCVSLNEVPSILPATQLADSCYSWMFESCRSLEKAPSLPATTMASCCYFSMFGDCASLSEAPELPATQLAENCYTLMLTDCKSLSQAPKLPATQLERYCYSGMFYGCTNMEEAPELPATELVEGCYNGMFAECTALVKAPELLAPKLVQECYRGMFENCSNLNYIQVGVMTLDNDAIATLDWVVGVDGPGTFVFPCGSKYDKHGVSEVPTNFTIISSPIVVFRNADSTELQRDTIDCQTVPEYRGEEPTIGEGYTFKGWDNDLTTLPIPATYYYTAVYEKEKDPVPANWLCFTAEEKGSQVWYTNDHGDSPDVHYSIDGGATWAPLLRGERVTLENVGDKVYLKGENPDGFSHGETHNSFSMTGKIAASGSVMSLIDAKGVTTVIPNDSCFIGLFSGCQALTQAPELTATTLTNGCYLNMFSACESLAKAPELPATELADHCYEYMFTHCKGLESAPELPATEMKDFCYKGMFQGCWSLVTAPKLPSKSLAFSCYTYMFGNCFGLENAPELPATTLAPGCYAFMFSECSSLAQAPELPASTLVESCYQKMFKGCKQLNYIKVGVMSLDNDLLATMDWVNGVDGPGTFVFPCGSKYDKHGASEVPTNFTIVSSPIVIFQNWDSTELQRDTIDCETVPEYRGEEPVREGYTFAGWDPELSVHPEAGVYYYTARYEDPSANNWLCFTAESDSSAFSYTTHEQHYPDVQYSIDGGLTWKKLEPGVTVKMGGTGKKVYLKGNNPDGFSISDTEYSTFVTEGGGISASGSVMSLVDGNGLSTKIPNNFCFAYLFKGAEFLTHAPELPATILREYCYLGMFNQCSRLTQAPVLPATRLESYCYANMFSECVSLEKAPELPATEISHYCYYNMFYGCEKLKVAPKLPAEVVYACCYAYMFQNCSSLVELPELPATEMAEACYLAMFQKCVLAEKAPALPAMTLWEGCYESMFSGCSSLTSAPELPAMNLKTRCYRSMFEDCISLTTAPVLPATALHPSCYHSMFRGCTNLNYIEVGVMSLDNDFEATENWVSGVDGPGTFIFPCGSKYDKHGASEVPTDFTIISSPIVVFQNPGGVELWRDTIDCKTVPEYKGEEPFLGEDYTFVGWDNELTVLPIPDTYYYTALYEEKGAANNRTDSAISACDSFAFKGIVYRENASWNDTLTTTEGVDSIIVYHLTIHKSVVREEYISAEGSYTWKEITFTEDASWSDTLQTAFGCDSIVQYRLEIKDDITDSSIVTDIPLTACDSFVYEGVTYRESAEWNDTLPAADGGDSILAYHLTIHKGVVREEYISAEGSYTWKEITFTEDASWSDTLQTAFGCDSIVQYRLEIKDNITDPAIVTDIPLTACDSLVYEGVTYRESREWNDTLPAANGGDSILAYHLAIHKSVVTEKSLTAVGSYTWQGVTYTEDASWNDTLRTAYGCDSIVRYSLTIEKETPDLQLTVDDELILVLPGGSETISYVLAGGEGSKYEVRQDGKVITTGDVTNDSTVSLTCPSSLEPGAYTATLEMCDGEGNCAEKDFTFNVMRPDDKQKSFYVKVWNDVVICRNGEGEFQTFQWYKERKKCENAAQQYLNDVNLLDGEYMVYVTDKDGKSYFIEPITYAPVEATYTITAEPNVVARNVDFTLKVSGVAEEELKNARIVVYRANGVVEKLLNEVETESVMRLKSGEYVIVLTVNDGKNANCKVLVK